MTFSDTVAQQREKQAKALKQFVMVSLVGSSVLHGAGLFLKISDLWKPEEAASEEITIVVTAGEPDVAIAPQEPVSQPIAAAEFSAPDTAPDIEPIRKPAIVDAPAPTTETPAAETPVPDEATVSEEPALEETAEDSPAEPSEAIAPPPATARNLSTLLAEIRRARQQPNASAAPNAPRPGENPRAETPGIAAAPTQPAPNITPESPAPSRGERRSREITCRGCDFDYPEGADGAEGTAQVIVETDDQGRVVSVMLSRSSGNAALDRAALEQARRRVRLNNARAGESYPIDVDFVQPNSDAAERVRDRGDRRSITVSDPEPETSVTPAAQPVGETPQNVSNDPQPQPSTPPSPTPAVEGAPSSPTPAAPASPDLPSQVESAPLTEPSPATTPANPEDTGS